MLNFASSEGVYFWCLAFVCEFFNSLLDLEHIASCYMLVQSDLTLAILLAQQC